MQVVSGEAGSPAVEVVCPWSNTGETLVESIDGDFDDGAAAADPDGKPGPSNGHMAHYSEAQVPSLLLPQSLYLSYPILFCSCRALAWPSHYSLTWL